MKLKICNSYDVPCHMVMPKYLKVFKIPVSCRKRCILFGLLVYSDFREKLMQLVASFENTEYTMGREGTVFFLFEYINYLNQLNAELENTERIWRQKLRSWLKYTGGSEQWERDIVYVNGTGDFKAYRFQVLFVVCVSLYVIHFSGSNEEHCGAESAQTGDEDVTRGGRPPTVPCGDLPRGVSVRRPISDHSTVHLPQRAHLALSDDGYRIPVDSVHSIWFDTWLKF